MTNWCHNRMKITGPISEITRFKHEGGQEATRGLQIIPKHGRWCRLLQRQWLALSTRR